jgi:hypothetical protein
MANLVVKDKALASFHEPDKRIGRYYPPNEALMLFLHAR